MFHHSVYRQHNSKIMYLNKTRLDRSCLNDQAILLEYYTLKGMYQIVYQLVRWSGLSGQDILLEYNTLKGVYQMLPSDWPICLVLNSGLTG